MDPIHPIPLIRVRHHIPGPAFASMPKKHDRRIMSLNIRHIVPVALSIMVQTTPLHASSQEPGPNPEAEFCQTPLPSTPSASPRNVFIFKSDEKIALGVAIRLNNGTIAQTKLTAKCFDFWDNPSGPVSVAREESPNPHQTLNYILTPTITSPGWFRIELTMYDGATPVTLKRKLGDPRSLETYHYLQFAVVPKPRATDTIPGSPFGIDTAVSLASPGIPPSELQAELAWLLGASWARDRMIWPAVNPAKGKFVWDQPLKGARLLHQHGLKILHMFQRPAPEWMRPPGGTFKSYPEDLRHAYAAAIEAARTLTPDGVGAFEIWNEHDIGHYSEEPPDVFASTLKAMALGLHSAPPPAPLALLGPWARNPEVGDYDKILAANEIAPYLDAYSFHTYAPVETGTFAEVIATHKRVARQTGFGNKPSWLTETGRHYGRNAIPDPTTAKHAQVRYLLNSYMQSLESDIRPVFWFWLLPWYGSPLSSAKDRIPLQFGMIDSNSAPHPVFSAYATMASQLGEARFINSFKTTRNSIYNFTTGGIDDRKISVVIPSVSSNGNVIPNLKNATEAVDVMGQPLALTFGTAGAVVDGKGFPFYIIAPQWADLGKTASGTQSKAAPPLPPPSEAKSASPIVIRVTYPRENIAYSPQKTEANWDGINSNWAPRGYTYKPGDIISAFVDVYNFGDRELSGQVEFKLPDGISASPMSSSLTIAAKDRIRIPVTIKTLTIVPPGQLWYCHGFFGEKTPPSVSASKWTPVSKR